MTIEKYAAYDLSFMYEIIKGQKERLTKTNSQAKNSSQMLFLKKKRVVYLFLTVLHPCCLMGFSLVASEGCSLLAVVGFLLWWLPLLWSMGTIACRLQ